MKVGSHLLRRSMQRGVSIHETRRRRLNDRCLHLLSCRMHRRRSPLHRSAYGSGSLVQSCSRRFLHLLSCCMHRWRCPLHCSAHGSGSLVQSCNRRFLEGHDIDFIHARTRGEHDC